MSVCVCVCGSERKCDVACSGQQATSCLDQHVLSNDCLVVVMAVEGGGVGGLTQEEISAKHRTGTKRWNKLEAGVQ